MLPVASPGNKGFQVSGFRCQEKPLESFLLHPSVLDATTLRGYLETANTEDI